ncbi:MAG: Bifunctional phosphoglucose/phosphomannose isomerase [Dehalococcoidia bacterium]|nr:Bifunctional phosphoglucose/phosphomannose isomerase [Dehalococcoidia bacterium]
MASLTPSPLDDPGLYARLDPTGLGGRIRGLPQQCLRAWGQARELVLPDSYADVRNVVVVGMGGSAIGGDLLADLASLEVSPPIAVCRDYRIPPYVGRDSLVIASSYSGNTEETLSVCQEAIERGARVVAVSTGGQLGQIARRQKLPLLLVDYRGEPRTALGYSFLVPLAILQKLKLVAPKDQDVEEAVEVMASLVCRLEPETPFRDNPAKELAAALHGRLIVVYGGGILSGVARRWKTQLNENSKAWAFVELLPEACHNAVVGFQWPRPVGRRVYGVLLSALSLHPRVKLGYQITGELLRKAGIEQRTVDGVGKGALAQMMSAVLFGDYTSYYLALLNGEDPSPIPPIDYLKARLQELR